MPNEPVKITAQELEEIKKLPSCQFMLGGTPQTGFFDKVNEKIYSVSYTHLTLPTT